MTRTRSKVKSQESKNGRKTGRNCPNIVIVPKNKFSSWRNTLLKSMMSYKTSTEDANTGAPAAAAAEPTGGCL